MRFQIVPNRQWHCRGRCLNATGRLGVIELLASLPGQTKSIRTVTLHPVQSNTRWHPHIPAPGIPGTEQVGACIFDTKNLAPVFHSQSSRSILLLHIPLLK